MSPCNTALGIHFSYQALDHNNKKRHSKQNSWKWQIIGYRLVCTLLILKRAHHTIRQSCTNTTLVHAYLLVLDSYPHRNLLHVTFIADSTCKLPGYLISRPCMKSAVLVKYTLNRDSFYVPTSSFELSVSRKKMWYTVEPLLAATPEEQPTSL